MITVNKLNEQEKFEIRNTLINSYHLLEEKLDSIDKKLEEINFKHSY